MPRPQNETIGRIPCCMVGCDAMADVRRLKNHERGRMYLVCPECGVVRPHGGRFQDYISRHLGDKPTGTESVPEPVITREPEQESAPKPVAAPEPAPVITPEPESGPVPAPPARRGLLSKLNDFEL